MLTNRTFTHGGRSFRVQRVALQSGNLTFDLETPSTITAASEFSSETLLVGNSSFAFSSATYEPVDEAFTWTSTGLSWSVNDAVRLVLTTPPAPLEALKARRGDGEVGLEWVPPGSVPGSPLTGYQVRRLVGGGAFGSWRNIPRSAPGQSNAESYAVTGLDNGTRYHTRNAVHSDRVSCGRFLRKSGLVAARHLINPANRLAGRALFSSSRTRR